MSLPPPGIYGHDTGVNPNPQTPFSPEHPVEEIPPSQPMMVHGGAGLQPHEVLRMAIRQMMGR